MSKNKAKKVDFRQIGQNISALMNACGIDASELSHQTGLPNSTISRLRSNTGDFSPNLSSLLPIADYFCITLSQLIGEEPISKDLFATFKPSKIRKLPLPVLSPETIFDYLINKTLNDDTFLDTDLPLSDEAFAYLLRGNAMEPHFPDKTILIIDPNIAPDNLDYILLLTKGKKIPTFRQLLVEGEEQYIRTLNPAFNEFIKLTSIGYEILGVMVQARMNFKNINLPFIKNIDDRKIKVS